MWIFAILIVLVLGGVAAVAAGLGSTMPESYTDRPDVLVPADGPLRGPDLRRVRFSVTVRGYRMSEVDALLARLAAEADERDAADVPGEPVPVAEPASAAEPARAAEPAPDAEPEP